MAPRAPRPGTTPSGGDKASPDPSIFVITLGVDELRLNLRDIGAMDEEIFEAQTKKTLSDVLAKLDHTPNVASLVWLARRKRGERKLTYREVLKKFPSRAELADMFADGTFDVDVVTEAELAAADEEVATADPLPAAGA